MSILVLSWFRNKESKNVDQGSAWLRWLSPLKTLLLKMIKEQCYPTSQKSLLTEICQSKLNEILSLFHIFMKFLYNLKWNKKNAHYSLV